MNDTIVTVVGNVVDSPRRANLASGPVTNFRMASTARRFDNRSQEFVDSGTFWVDVECWNDLSTNVSGSISKGDPVIVQGALTTHSWESDNGRRSAPRVKAFAVGPNLARGTADFKRSKPARAAADREAAGAAGPLAPTGVVEDGDSAAPMAGRDYVGDTGTLYETTPADLPEPAHV